MTRVDHPDWSPLSVFRTHTSTEASWAPRQNQAYAQKEVTCPDHTGNKVTREAIWPLPLIHKVKFHGLYAVIINGLYNTCVPRIPSQQGLYSRFMGGHMPGTSSAQKPEEGRRESLKKQNCSSRACSHKFLYPMSPWGLGHYGTYKVWGLTVYLQKRRRGQRGMYQ